MGLKGFQWVLMDHFIGFPLVSTRFHEICCVSNGF